MAKKIEGLLTSDVVDGFQKMEFYKDSPKVVWIEKAKIIRSDTNTEDYGELKGKKVGKLTEILLKDNATYKVNPSDATSKSIDLLINNTDKDKDDTVSSTRSWNG